MAKVSTKTRKDVQDLGFEETDNPTAIPAINSLEVRTSVGVMLGYNVKHIVIKTKTIQIWLVLTHWKNMSKIFFKFTTKIWLVNYNFISILFLGLSPITWTKSILSTGDGTFRPGRKVKKLGGITIATRALWLILKNISWNQKNGARVMDKITRKNILYTIIQLRSNGRNKFHEKFAIIIKILVFFLAGDSDLSLGMKNIFIFARCRLLKLTIC